MANFSVSNSSTAKTNVCYQQDLSMTKCLNMKLFWQLMNEFVVLRRVLKASMLIILIFSSLWLKEASDISLFINNLKMEKSSQ